MKHQSSKDIQTALSKPYSKTFHPPMNKSIISQVIYPPILSTDAITKGLLDSIFSRILETK